MLARDERAVCKAERAWSRGGQGRPAARAAEQNRALVTAESATCAAFSGSQCVQRESSCSFANGSTHSSISNAGWRALPQRGSKGRGINPRPTTKFGVGLWTKVAGASARRKQPSSQGVADRHFVGRNAGSSKTSPSSVRNPDVRIRGRIMVGPHLGQSSRVNSSPVTDFLMRFYAVVWRPTVGVEFPGLEDADDDPFGDGNASVDKAAGCPSGKSVEKRSGCHQVEICAVVITGARCMNLTVLIQNPPTSFRVRSTNAASSLLSTVSDSDWALVLW